MARTGNRTLSPLRGLVAACLWSIVAAAAAAADGSAALEAAIATITAGELREHAGLLADDTLEGRAAGSRGGRAAARYLETRLRELALRPAGERGTFIQRFNPGYQNILGMVAGTDARLKDEYLIVGAHYDHVGFGNRGNSNGPLGYIHNGADDNASGVAVLLEMIDALARTGWQPRRSIIFAFWDGEEINLLGSRHWVRQPTVPLARVPLTINVDMIGRMTRGRLEVEGTRTAAGLRRLLSSRRLPQEMWLDFTWEYQENSDHWPFYEAGVPSLLMHTGLHGDYHRPSDDVEKLNVAGMQQAAGYILEATCRLADEDRLPKFRAASRSESQFDRREREAPLPPSPARLGLRWDWRAADGEPVLAVAQLTPGGAAEQAGLQRGDRITAVDGHAIVNETLLPAAVLNAPQEITLSVRRGGEELPTVVVKLPGRRVRLGLSWRADAAAPGSVYVTRVVPYSPADRARIRVHDRVYALDGQPFADEDDLLRRIQSLLVADAERLQFEVESFGRLRTVDVELRLPTAPSEDASL